MTTTKTKIPEPTSACTVVFNPATGLVLAEKNKRGYGLPGGRREHYDASSFACAARELREETGAVLRAARSILTYAAGPYFCEAFLAVNVTNLPSDAEAAERGAQWVEPEALVHSSARFPAYCSRLFARMASQQSLTQTCTAARSRGIDWETLHAARSTPHHLAMMEQTVRLIQSGRGAITELRFDVETITEPESGKQTAGAVLATFRVVHERLAT